MERTSGLVSIIVTCHNRRRYIKDCLNSLIRQTYPHLELIIVDDESHPIRIAKQVRYLRHHADIGLVGTAYQVIRKGKPLPIQPTWLRYGPANVHQSYAAGQHCISLGTVLFRGSLFDKFGGLTRRIQGAEDYEFVAKLITQGVRADNIPEVLYFYQRHATQRSNKFYAGQ